MSFRGQDGTSRQVIDVAVGILVGLRGCARADAFDELVRVVHQTGIGLGAIASGLVAVASGSSSADHAEAFSAWGDLIRSSRTGTLAAAR
ncbi:ANTAR domain-containing protein [Mycobacterium sp. pW049]|uniref:ANTAR domain-containing protein n=1 Tax=[Mycobacterium] bulgaricum TaxID=3238985 RepID=UPI00351AB580